MRVLGRQELHDLVLGCTILGAGGGGTLAEGVYLIDRALDAGKSFRLADLTEVGDDDFLATPYFCGSVSREIGGDKGPAMGALITAEACVEALSSLEKVCERSLSGVIPTELGGLNTTMALYSGAMTDRYIVDGDPAGRAVPELQHTTYYLDSVPIYPIAVANNYGESAVFMSLSSDARAEELTRQFAIASDNVTAVVDHPVNGKTAKASLLPHTLSQALSLGRAHRLASDAGEDAIAAVAREGRGRIIFQGLVEKCIYQEQKGFTFGDVSISGDREFAHRRLRLWQKNENIITWLDDVPYVCCPDLLCAFERKSGQPLTNPHLEEGVETVIVALPCAPLWKTQKGLQLLGPRSFGFDFDYKEFIV